MRIKNKFKELVTSVPALVMLANVASVCAVDIYVPAMPKMAIYFDTTPVLLQFSVSISLIGSSLLTPWVGPLSDAYGRRRIFIWCQGVYAISALLAPLSPSIYIFILSRFFQGVSSTAAIILGFPILTDVYERKQAAIYLAYFTTTITLALIFAPLVGGYLAHKWGWQACFIFLASLASLSTFSLYMWLPETLRSSRPFSLKSSLHSYLMILSHSRFLRMAVLPSLMIGGMVAFLTNSSFYFFNTLGVSAEKYGVYQSIIMIGNCLFSYFAGHCIHRFGTQRALSIGMFIFGIGGTSFLLTTLWLDIKVSIILATVSLYTAGLGFVFGAITSEAMAIFPHNAGAASAMLSLVRGLLIAACVSVCSYFYNGKLDSIAIFMACLVLVCLGLHTSLKRWYGT